MRTKEQMKTRIVEITLEGDVTIKDLQDKLSRKDTVALFEMLEEKGFGKFKAGTQGQGKISKFSPNESCPKSYSYEVTFYRESKRVKKDRESIVVDEPKKVLEDANVLSICNDGGNYALLEYDNKVHLHNANGHGFKTIEASVEHVWDALNGVVTNNRNEPITTLEDVCSALRGVGYINLTE